MDQYEQIGYVYFDPNQWQALPLQNMYIDISKLHDNFKENQDNVS